MAKKIKIGKSSKIAIGLAFTLLGVTLVLTNLGQISKRKQPDFVKENVIIEGLSSTRQDNKNSPNRIILPDLSIDLPVKKAKVITGYWEVFTDTAGWGEGSGIPGQPGNQVIFAHAREGLFLPLRKIKRGMKIYVFNQDKYFSYEVKEIKEVLPNQIETIAPTSDETLTLYTCSGFEDSKRLIVVAKRT